MVGPPVDFEGLGLRPRLTQSLGNTFTYFLPPPGESVMIELEEHNEVDPLCPHCELPLRAVWYQEIRGFAGKRYAYFCSKCHKVIGISHRKGFFMG